MFREFRNVVHRLSCHIEKPSTHVSSSSIDSALQYVHRELVISQPMSVRAVDSRVSRSTGRGSDDITTFPLFTSRIAMLSESARVHGQSHLNLEAEETLSADDRRRHFHRLPGREKSCHFARQFQLNDGVAMPKMDSRIIALQTE